MKKLFDEIIENFNYIGVGELSEKGYPIFEFRIPSAKAENLAPYGAYQQALFGHSHSDGFYTTQLVFYSDDEKIVNQLQTMIKEKETKKKYDSNLDNFKDFFNSHKDCFIDLKKNPIKKLSYWETKIYQELGNPKTYQKIQKDMDIGVCYLIRDEKLYTFRIPTQWGSAGNPALKGYYTKPINTQEEMNKHREVVNKLFDAGKLKYEVMLTGILAKECIDNIQKQEAKLPNEYEYEQICILENYAKLQKYPVKKSMDSKGNQQIILTTHYGVVEVSVGKTEKKSLVVSYEDNKNVKMNLSEFVDKFYYDKTKEKVNDLVKKFKAK